MHLIPPRSGEPSVRRTATFTGEVWADPVSSGEPTVNIVVFAPGARTYWHRHHGGQLIIASHGRGFVVRDDGGGGPVVAGQSIWTPAGEMHWHGAGPDSVFAQTAYSFGTTEWLHEVLDEEYERAVQEASW
ncbi:cupin domain-containing protein [Nocardia sp. NBC_00416]|uniref:cupin domain-containing protein n=1 Tax=Nocardia sp. NBC_00416 TaxID=2975991 RepID=UPI002E230211